VNLHPGVEIGAIEIGGLEALKRTVCAGLGAALLPMVSLEPVPRGAVARELVDVGLGLPVGLVSVPGNGPWGRASEALFAELERLRA
jgi:DNA-binding transcriptional LysR family regulator